MDPVLSIVKSEQGAVYLRPLPIYSLPSTTDDASII
jgi:hypothetical protein